MNKNIRDLVLEAMTTDDSFNEGNSRNIIKLYNSASITEKEMIDNIFVNLCGFSFASIILNSQIEELPIKKQSTSLNSISISENNHY